MALNFSRLFAASAAMPKTSAAVSKSLIKQLGLTGAPERVWREAGRGWGRPAVGPSEDLERILALPRRPRPSDEVQATMAASMTARLRLERSTPCRCAQLRPGVQNPCITELFPVQGWYLWEAQQGGILGHLAVGSGKTLLGCLLPMVVPDVQRAVLLIPPSLRRQFALDFEVISQHFKTPNRAGGIGTFYSDRPVLHVLAYSELSHARCATWLKANEPDLIISDEAQNLRARGSVRTSRFIRYCAETNREIKFYCHSGSLTTRSLDDYGHLSSLSLREQSPLPLDPITVREWCGALDPEPKGGAPAPSGALRKFCAEGESARSGFRRRLLDTRGVISTDDARLPIRLVIHERKISAVPKTVLDALNFTRSRSTRPDGEELVDVLEVKAVCRQLACGIYLRWKYPRKEPESLILDWFAKRQAWHRELREKLLFRRDLLDSPLLCQQAAMRAYANYTGQLPVWRAASWPAWLAIRDSVQPVSEAVWVDDFLAKDAAAWASKAPGIVWTGHPAFGQRVAELGGFAYYGAGAEASERIMQEDGSRSIVVSWKAHGQGKNLQMFHRVLVANPPSDGGAWEQLIGRCHRYGQRAEEVQIFVYRHTAEYLEALETALQHARYVQATTGKAEKLLFAEINFGG